MDELIARLEALGEKSPERELRAIDDEIHATIGGKDPPPEGAHWRHTPYTLTAPRYTRDIDAALLVIPANYSAELMFSAAGPPQFTRAKLWNWRRSPPASDPGNEWKSEGNRPLPINTVIAALKARQATP